MKHLILKILKLAICVDLGFSVSVELISRIAVSILF